MSITTANSVIVPKNVDALCDLVLQGNEGAIEKFKNAFEKNIFSDSEVEGLMTKINDGCEEGNMHAQYICGILHEKEYIEENDVVTSFEMFKKAADQGHILAKLELGIAYRDAIGVEQDYVKAMEIFLALEGVSDNGRLFNSLGYIYDNALGVERDVDKAEEYYEKAIEKGYTNGMINLGLLYARGEVGGGNTEKAFRLFHKALEKNNEFAKEELEKIIVDNPSEYITFIKKILWGKNKVITGLKKQIITSTKIDEGKINKKLMKEIDKIGLHEIEDDSDPLDYVSI